jgi:hypothetical protein
VADTISNAFTGNAFTREDEDDAFEHGRRARLRGQQLSANPHFGGGKSDFAKQLRWDLGWQSSAIAETQP